MTYSLHFHSSTATSHSSILRSLRGDRGLLRFRTAVPEATASNSLQRTAKSVRAVVFVKTMGELLRWLGLSVGLVIPDGSPDAAHKREQYGADVTYGTNNEFGFDYLRDNMAMTRERQAPARGAHRGTPSPVRHTTT